MQISSILAKKVILNSQLLDGRIKLSNGSTGFFEIINHLGYVQIDTISVINRAHHHIFWTRNNSYTENVVHNLQKNERLVFEYWGHAMSYLPMEDYRFYLPRMKNFKNPSSPWAQQQIEKAGHLLKPVLKRIKEEGPLSSKDFERLDGKKGGTWWDWKPAKVALELLFWRGELMITERKKFNKIYDLTERVLPSHIDKRRPSQNEIAEFLIKRAITANGVISENEILKFLQPGSSRDSDLQTAGRAVIKKRIKKLIEANEIIEVEIDGINSNKYYADEATLNSVSKLRSKSKQVFLLSPFDNLIIQRERIKIIFDFDYTIECYVPEAKRKYGYFVLPILYGNDFVGRLDPKADRKSKTLIIKNIFFEKGFNEFDELMPKLAKQISAMAKFNNCEIVKIQNTFPQKVKSAITKYLNS
ncbi:MAG: winged helix-turn-helix domain-containing protein [Ignavibacteriae bacterium]|nr:winged helix-turn-helix domain-containing protein [Ignavibacteriota bacterium]NOG98187.1 winged helix-turn-helix domain-containing protein [Ignavibacteriota bacterium]